MTRIEPRDDLVGDTLVGCEDWDELPAVPVVLIVDLGRPPVEPSGPDPES